MGMSGNTRLEHALYDRPGFPHLLMSTSNPDPAVEPPTTRPKSEVAYVPTSLDPCSVPLSDEDDLFDLFINYPAEDKPQVESSTAETSNLVDSASPNSEDNIALDQVGNPPKTPVLPEDTAASHVDEMLAAHGIDLSDSSAKLSDAETLLIQSYKFLAPQESSGKHSQQLLKINDSLPTAILVHTAISASIATTIPTVSPVSFTSTNSQTVTTTVAPPTSIVMHSSSADASPHSPAGYVGSSVVNFNGPVNTVNMSIHSLPQSEQQPQHTPNSHTPVMSLVTPGESGGSVQHAPLAEAQVPLPSCPAQTHKPQARNKELVLPNSYFKPTPLKQTWTSSDLTPKEATTGISSQPSLAQTSLQSHPLTQLDHESQSGFQPGTPVCVSPRVVSKASAHYSSQGAATIPSQVATIVPQGTTGATQTFDCARPRASPSLQNEPRATHHPNTSSPALRVQQSQSCPQLQTNQKAPLNTPTQPALTIGIQPISHLQATSIPADALAVAPTGWHDQAPQGSKEFPLRRTETFASVQTLPTTHPSGSRGRDSAAQSAVISANHTRSNSLTSSLTQFPAYSNLNTRVMTMTPPLSPAGTSHLVQPQTTGGPYAHTQVQSSAQVQPHLGSLSAPDPYDPVVAVWLVQDDKDGKWYYIERVVDGDEPDRVYPAPAPAVLPPSLHVHYPGYSAYPPQPLRTAQSYHHTLSQPASQEVYEASRKAQEFSGPRQPPSNQAQASAKDQEYMRQHSSRTVELPYSTPSLSTTRVPEAPFVVTPPPTTGFRPRSGDDTFSSTYWRYVGSDTESFRSPSLRNFPSAPAHGHPTPNRAPTSGPSAGHSHLRPSSSTATTRVAAPFRNQSSSGPSSVSRSTSLWTSNPPAPKDIGKRRRVETDNDEDEIEEVLASKYHVPSSKAKGKRAKHGRGSNWG